jgi:RecG-like helicase
VKDNLVEMKKELDYLSEKVFSAENEKSRLIRVEEELYFLFRKNDRLLQELKYDWKTGEMNLIIHDTEMELKRHQRNAVQAIEDEVNSLNKKMRLLEGKEQDLHQKIRYLSSRDLNNR